jgi:hypothetical protein
MKEELFFYELLFNFKSYFFKKIHILSFVNLDLFNSINILLDKEFFYDELDFILTSQLYD